MSVAMMLAAFLGASLGIGLWCLMIAVPAAWRTDLDSRITPYLDPDDERVRQVASIPQAWSPARAWSEFTTRGAAMLDRMLGGADSVRQRLYQSGTRPDVEGFRVQQVIWGVSAAVAATALASVFWWSRGGMVLPLAVLVACAALLGVIARDQLLTRRAQSRQRRILQEFPAIAELLALAVAAGEGTVQALRRVSETSTGDLSDELDYTMSVARSDTSMQEALQGLADRMQCPPLTRFVDGMVVAMQRGTPLGDVLRAQAQDVRETARQELIESGGKREIGMMIPIVFLVLPITVLFAVYPGFTMLRFDI